jgi:hypothetical protein
MAQAVEVEVEVEQPTDLTPVVEVEQPTDCMLVVEVGAARLRGQVLEQLL